MAKMGKTVRRGRPRGYKDEYCEQAYRLCLLGYTDAELAKFFSIAESTLYAWTLDYPDISEFIKKGKDEADSKIAESLYHRAKGYSHPDVDIRTVSLGDNCGSQIVETDIVKHYPPDTTACIFWLKNRQKANWRDRTETELTGKDGADLNIIVKISDKV